MINDKKIEVLIYSRFWPELVDYLDNELGSDYRVIPVKTLSDDKINSSHPGLVIADCYTNEEIDTFSSIFLNAPVFSIGFVSEKLDIIKAFNRNLDLDDFIDYIKDYLRRKAARELDFDLHDTNIKFLG